MVSAADAELPAQPEVFAEGLDRPFGIVFYPADDPQFVYVAAADQVVRYPYSAGDRAASGPAEVIVADIPTERHWTRDIVVAPDGERLLVSIGSASNVAGAMPEMAEDEVAAHEEAHGVGAAWGDEEDRAVVRVFEPDGGNMQIVFYTGEAFPEEFRGDAFATMRGSWNRELRTGYKVVRALMEDGTPTGEYDDFMTGFVLDEAQVWGRPTGIAMTQDGALLVSDDANGTIFRVTASAQ